MIRLDELDPGEVDRLTDRLLAHPRPEIRRETLERLERRRKPVHGWTVESEPVAEAAEAGLRALLASGDRAARTLARSALADPRTVLRRGAVVGLVRYGDQAERAEALSSLAALVCSPEADDRLGAAVVLGQLAEAAPMSHVQVLIADSQCSVARAALESAARLADADVDLTDLWPSVVDAASHPDRAGAARTALRHARGCADRLLLRQLDHDDPVRVQSALTALSQSDALVDRDLVRGFVARELDTCDVLRVALDQLGTVDAVSLVAAALREELRCGVDRVALLVALGDRQARARVLAARPGLTESVPDPMALEVLETALPANFAARLMPMIEGARTASTGSGAGALEQLRAIATGRGQFRHRGWLRACAFDAARRLDAPWLVKDLATTVAGADPHPEVVAFAASVTRSERPNVLSTIELVLLLKGVDLFAELPDRVLAQVAARLDQVDLAADEVVFVGGDSGDCLYVVAQGSVRVQSGDRLVNDLAEGEVFGEMALLDPAPRSATVVAREPTRLTRLDRESFLELVNEQPTVGIGVIRVLTGRLRARLADIVRLDAELRARPSV